MSEKVSIPRIALSKALLALFFSTLLGVLLFECFLRLLGHEPYSVNAEQIMFWRHDPRLGWRHEPGMEGDFSKPPLFDTRVKINSKGLRDKEYDYEKKKGMKRVAVLGDSFVWGFGVEQTEIFTEIIEAEVEGVEVINGGVSGYSTDQSLLWFMDEGIKYDPDLTILFLCHNDIEMNPLNLVYHKYHINRPSPSRKAET